MGSFHPLKTILSVLPVRYPAPVIVAVHRAPDSSPRMAELLSEHCLLPVAEVEDKDCLVAGRVFLAPSDYHLLVEGNGLVLSTDPIVKFARPSFDLLLQSAAESSRCRIVCSVLSGASDDGAVGAGLVARSGGVVLAQEPEEAECPVMPQAVLRSVPEAKNKTTQGIGEYMARLV